MLISKTTKGACMAAIFLLSGYLSADAEDIATGTTNSTVNLIAPTGGICRAIYAEPGQRVQVGERLAAIGPPASEVRIEQAREQMRQSAARAEQSRIAFLAALQDHQRGNSDSNTVEIARIEMEMAHQTAVKARDDLRRLQDAVNPVFIYSPADAAVKNVFISVDQPVTEGDTLISLEMSRAEKP